MEPSAKRTKLSRGEDDYLPGNIIKIELCNFMTFDELIVKPGPRLNLVVGPNGSGKSSVVCAIALGLGGEPQLLGRSSTIGAYVKRGEESGYIGISLRGYASEQKISIKRKIDTHNKSEWMLNGNVVSKKDVVEIIQRFNIQVNNLTQFLPQDRVCEFAKLTPVQLLEETERAVGDPQLPIQHHSLVDKSRELKRLEVTVKQNGDTLDQLKALNAEQEKDVERVLQREELLAKVESMRKKLPWLKYDKKQDEWKRAKEVVDNAKRELAEAVTIANDHKERLEEQKQRKLKHDGNCKNERRLLSTNIEIRKKVLDEECRLGVEVRGKYNHMVELRREDQSRREKNLKEKKALAADEIELANMPTHDDHNDKIETLNHQIWDKESSVNEKRLNISGKEKALDEKTEELGKCLNSLRGMESANNILLQALKNTGADYIFQAYHWVQEHRHELSREIYGPVLLEVKVHQPVYANYLEEHVPKYIWKAFITQDSTDRDILVTNLTKFDVAVINYDEAGRSNKAAFAVSEEMRKLGIYCRLDQVFDAPNAVKEVLTSLSGLEHAFVGTMETDRKANEVHRLGIFDLWTPENHYRWIRSRYGGHVSTSVEHVPVSRLFQSSANVGEIEKCRSKIEELKGIIATLEESCELLQAELRYLEDDASELYKQRGELICSNQQHNKKRHALESRIAQRKRKILSLEEEDLDTITKKLVHEAAELNLQRIKFAINLKKSLIEAASHKSSYTIKHMSSIELETKIKELEIDFKQKEKFSHQALERYNFCKEESENHRRELVGLKREAESIAAITPELEQEFLKIPSTIEDLETAIEDNISEANSILFLNQNILEEYESRQRKIEAISRKLEADDQELQRCLAEVDALKEKWLPRLRSLVAEINKTFSLNFQEMAVAGEVSLDEHDTDYDKFGIVIKVKFRQTGQLQVLSAHHQSGGERSVSTILYLVSLQDLTHCPFRVVDEINQGMDPINERKMFQQIVQVAMKPNASQCFLLTPKLLSDLQYSNACCVLHIMNGPWIVEPAKVWRNGKCWSTARLFAEQEDVEGLTTQQQYNIKLRTTTVPQ
ncbi:structural maintenance of chromosomes protein 5-like isoform X2 [Macadamia integrifolia]|uniref:structural maintenance of chromosomes protein 5-like isoform X2 n=1 Tax=Macadamia integrifolia TaxID=60698 RepID=UPI001C4E72F3|nr:structural maintenance of chromosomes protein 5-like isoform X2 [Macadamia integrifolia]